jgi:hypothetical protein
VAEKLPAIEVAVAEVTCHWKLVQEPDVATPGNSEVQLPPNEPPDPDPEGGAGAGAAGALGADGADGAVGDRIVVLLSTRAHAVASVETAASVASNDSVLFMIPC